VIVDCNCIDIVIVCRKLMIMITRLKNQHLMIRTLILT